MSEIKYEGGAHLTNKGICLPPGGSVTIGVDITEIFGPGAKSRKVPNTGFIASIKTFFKMDPGTHTEIYYEG